MRIAILIFGRLNKCAEHYDNILEKLGKYHTIDFYASSDNSPESILNTFISLFKPIAYDNSPVQYNYDLGKYPSREGVVTIIHNMTCHFINKNRVWKLFENYIHVNKISYDAAVSMRLDLVFNNAFNFEHLLPNTIYIPIGSDHIVNGINDQVAYGKLDVIKKYNLINVIELLEQKLTIPHPESLTWANIRFHGINICRVNLLYVIDR